MFEREVSWDDGRRVVEMGMLAEGLKSCCFYQQPIQLKNVVDEKRYGLAKKKFQDRLTFLNRPNYDNLD